MSFNLVCHAHTPLYVYDCTYLSQAKWCDGHAGEAVVLIWFDGFYAAMVMDVLLHNKENVIITGVYQ